MGMTLHYCHESKALTEFCAGTMWIQREQEAREERQRLRREQGAELEDDGAGSFDDGDPYTTNLYVGNLAPDVDEEVRRPSLQGHCPPHACHSVGRTCCHCCANSSRHCTIWLLR